MKVVKFTREQFDEIFKQLNLPVSVDFNYLYKLYSICIDGSQEMLDQNYLGKSFPVNSLVILMYLVNEYIYALTKGPIQNNDDEISRIVSITLDKYFTNEHLNYKNQQFTDKFSIVISTLEMYLNLMLGVLEKFPQKDPRETLLLDTITKALKLCKAITGLLTSGFATEAFSIWRTLHETESLLLLISKYDNKIIKPYLKHMNYAIAFRSGAGSKEETDKVFENIKSEMKEHNLKSKDMKKFIEYGWMYNLPEFDEEQGFKLNFRDGVEKMAGLSDYSKIYEMASEIAHSSPLLIYSRNQYFYCLTILQLYESFFRIEKVFCSFYLPNISKIETDRFLKMRGVYYPIIIDVYEHQKKVFENIMLNE